VGLALGVRQPWTLLTLAFGGFTAQVTLGEIWLPVGQRMKANGEGFAKAFVEAQVRRGRRRFGAYVVHAGAVLVIVAIAVSSTMGASKEVQLRVGESVQVGAYTLTFVKAEQVREPHRESLLARIAVTRNGRDLGTLSPGMNQYDTQREPIGTPDVRTSLFEDLYLSALSIDPAGGTMGLLAMTKPMVGCIWLATAIMALGGLIALIPRRAAEYAVKAPAVAPASDYGAAARS
jgi:cytochrome c-type biogenesis protein CcmF